MDKRIEDLVILQYASNCCYVVVSNAVDLLNLDGLEIDLEKGFWSYKNWKDKKIGESRRDDTRRYGVIGVYDRTNTQHLGRMVTAGINAVRDRGSVFDD